jgi:hypothetical protein
MKVLQVSPSYRESCGIGHFSRNLEAALRDSSVDMSTTTSLTPANGFDVTVIQHEWGLFPSMEDVYAFCAQSPVPVVLFAHSGGVERFAESVDGYIAMHEGIVSSVERPSLVIPHPTWAPPILEDRQRLRERFGLGDKSLVVGSSGFITGFRQFPDILARLLPALREEDGFVELVIAKCAGRWYSEGERVERELDRLRCQYPDSFRYDGRFLSNEELNLRLQACDLLWCFTNRASSAYSSGAAVDQYASGTTMILADIDQHRHVIARSGVIAAGADIHGFVDTILSAIRERHFPRHDPAVYSWADASREVADFLRELVGERYDRRSE